MQSIQVGQFKAELSSILKKIQNDGEKFVIEFGKKHKKIAMIVPYVEEVKKRKFGQLDGQMQIPDDFDEKSEDINEMFYGKCDKS